MKIARLSQDWRAFVISASVSFRDIADTTLSYTAIAVIAYARLLLSDEY